MKTYLHNETGYNLEDSGVVVTLKTYEAYFRLNTKSVVGYEEATYNKVTLDDSMDYFLLEYSIPADYCSTCEDLGVYDGICDGYGKGHNDPHQEFIYYKTLELYTEVLDN